jgi:intracellular multiplication protein IcmL
MLRKQKPTTTPKTSGQNKRPVKPKSTVAPPKKRAPKKAKTQGQQDVELPPKGVDIMFRGSWDRRQYGRALKITFFSLLVNLALILVIVLMVLFRPEPRYFSVTNDFRVVELAPLSEPYVDDAGLRNWSSDVVSRTFSLNFLHVKRSLEDVRKFYAPDAFQQLIVSLKKSGIISLITEKRLSVSVVLDKAPVITAKGVLQGTMSWKLEIPIVASYESSKGVETTQHLVATMLIQRADLREYPEGVYIKQMVLR